MTDKPAAVTPRGSFVMFEEVTAENPPRGSENWPIVDVKLHCSFTMLDEVAATRPLTDLSHLLAERIAAAPAEKRAALQAQVNAEIARAIAAASPVA